MPRSSSVEATCHCGAVKLELPKAPESVTECNCSICRRYGVLWAYYVPKEALALPARELTDAYAWDDRSIEFHRCRICGCVTHWWPVQALPDRFGVNARLMPPDLLERTRVRKLDGAVTEKYVDE